MPTTEIEKAGKICRVRILEQFCKSCGLCIDVCPKDGLCLSDNVNDKGYRVAEFVDGTECTACCGCAQMCPDAAIEIVIEEEQ